MRWWRRFNDWAWRRIPEMGFESLASGRPDEAVKYFAATLNKRTQSLGPEHRETLASAANLGMAYREAGRIEESVQLLERTYDQLRKLFGDQDPNALICATELAASRYRSGDRDSGRALLIQTLDLQLRLPGDSAATLVTECQLATCYRMEERMWDVFSLAMSPVETYVTRLGENHYVTLRAREIWADLRAAIKSINESFDDPEGHPLSAANRSVVSMAPLVNRYALDHGNEWEKGLRAAELWEHARRWYERNDGPDHLNTLCALRHKADCLVFAGATATSIPVQESLCNGLRKALGPDHPDTVKAESGLAGCYSELGRTEESIALAEHVVKIWTETRGASARETLEAMFTLASALYKRGRTSEAEPLLQHLEYNGWKVRKND